VNREKCAVDCIGTVTPCAPLDRCTDSIYKRGSGVQRVSLMIFGDDPHEDGKTIRHSYALKSGEFKKGVVLNFCPFCGTNIQRPRDGLEDRPMESKS